jgi:preprotein translocase subunit SecG
MKSVLMILEAVVAIALIASVVLQSGKSAGMSGSIAGGAETLFGGKKKGLDEMLARVTMILGIVFGILTLILGRVLSTY